MARPRLPTNVLELRGTIGHDPKKYEDRKNEPAAKGKPGAPPKDWDANHKKAWRDIVRYSLDGSLCASDRLAVEAAAICLVHCRAGSLDAIKEFRQWVARFGMSPADRSRVSVPAPPKEASPYERPARE